MDMITPEDNVANAYFTNDKDGDEEYRKFSFKVNVTDPEFPFSTCSSSNTTSRSKTALI